MKKVLFVALPLVALAIASVRGRAQEAGETGAATDDSVEEGRYLVLVGGCNDCHTPGFLQSGFEVPESEWLTGVPIGWQGPWGTSYAANLRLLVAGMTEDGFVSMLHSRDGLPPMPWAVMHVWHEDDLRKVYRYIASLGPAGEQMPAAVPPGQEPTTPYMSMIPQMPAGAAVPPDAPGQTDTP